MEKCPPEVLTQIRYFSGPSSINPSPSRDGGNLLPLHKSFPSFLIFKRRLADEFAYDYLEVPDESDSDYLVSEGESESNNEFKRSLGQGQQILEYAQYLEDVREGLLPTEGKTEEDESGILNCDIQAVFDKATQALHAILNESSSTLHILGLYWTSFKPLPIQEIIPPLPFRRTSHSSVVLRWKQLNTALTRRSLFYFLDYAYVLNLAINATNFWMAALLQLLRI